MKLKLVLLLTIISALVAVPTVVPAEDTSSSPGDVALNYPVLLTACRVAKGDKYFESGTILVLAFVVGSTSSDIYEHASQHDKFLAEMHYDEGGLDAQGGIWSTIRARDIYNSLSTRKFTLLTSAKDYQSNKYFNNPPPCNISYVGLDKYEHSMGQK